MCNGFNLKAPSVKALAGLIVLLGGYKAVQNICNDIDFSDACSVEQSVFYPSPDHKWYAKVKDIKCPDSAEKREIFLVREPNDRVRQLIYSSEFHSNSDMHIAWQRSDELVIRIPDNIKPDFPAKQYAGINVSYSIY